MRLTLGMIVVVTACGGDGGGPPSINANKDNACSQIAAVACYNMYTCCSEGEIEDRLGVTDPRTEAQCNDDLTRLCERDIASYTFSIANGRVTFDGKTLDDCLKALIAPADTCATIASVLPWADACMDSAWVGAVADGGTCDYPYECASLDSYCAPNRTCTAKPTQGQPCISAGCATGLYCSSMGTCQPQAGENQPCTTTGQCLKDLFCDFSATMPVCTALRDGGQPCTGNQTCKSSQCVPGTCAITGNSCYTNSNCYMHCANSTSYCTQDSSCGTGMCSMTATYCTVPTDCTGVGNTCVFPIKCVTGTCQGNPVCADAHLTVDYCDAALSSLPVPH